ncbi:methylated-DNA-[protein]-cysteine S-methyltransferase [Spiroplasma syrphidicola EA-1]|uniref:methylated-DNA--[protein]-cysteine S-methyltransferase n=1 Tax=Spiroplasma syrphidicola EA-1 TaxID=1276229 RepID=R4U4Y0_9MOLU|nr:methylated-DNA--[protein]-cysteine S-methyltransferase [Spiroplasma syrphidicola]AGM26537.1 methylated-DNA-[protein]-cysteine S-methyltransferase [Spiroplasma syrphidicola EA-1]
MGQTVTWYYCKMIINNEEWIIAASDKGLIFVGQTEQELINYKDKIKNQEIILRENGDKLVRYCNQIKEYFHHQRKVFTLPLDLIGTTFQQVVWNSLLTIPYGQTKYYQEIAEIINRPQATRAVGQAIGANPVLIIVPCHRVIGKNKNLTGFRGGLTLKEHLLKLEQE